MRSRVLGTVQVAVKRTYNYKRGTVLDHKTGIVLPLAKVMNGDIGPFIEARRDRERAKYNAA